MSISSSQEFSQLPQSEKIEVLGGHFAPLTLYRQVERHMPDRISQLRPERLYTLREIYGEDAWEALGNAWAHRMAGRCFAHMVSKGIFPLDFRRYKRSRTLRYVLE